MTGTDWADQMAGELMRRIASTTSPDMRLQIAAEVLRAAAARGARDMREMAIKKLSAANLQFNLTNMGEQLPSGEARALLQDFGSSVVLQINRQVIEMLRALPDPEGRQEGER